MIRLIRYMICLKLLNALCTSSNLWQCKVGSFPAGKTSSASTLEMLNATKNETNLVTCRYFFQVSLFMKLHCKLIFTDLLIPFDDTHLSHHHRKPENTGQITSTFKFNDNNFLFNFSIHLFIPQIYSELSIVIKIFSLFRMKFHLTLRCISL